MDYAPPEQQGVDGEPSAKSDVYAFGKTLYRLLTGESPQTLHQRRLTQAPELLCNCVEIVPDKWVDLLQGLERLLSPVSEPVKQSPKPVARIIQQEKYRWEWWNQLNYRHKDDYNWISVFKKAINFEHKPMNDTILEKIVNLQELNYNDSGISNLEPLLMLTNLRKFYCGSNKISDLEPLYSLNNWNNWGQSKIN